MAASSRAQVLRLYRALLRESQRFSSYNYRMCNIIGLINETAQNIEESRKQICQNRFCIGNTLTECMQFHLRTYAIRRIRDAFRENKNIKDSEKIEQLVNKAKANLEVIRRQVTIGQLYSVQKLVIESPGNT